ncbi:MAG: EthD family reductase [Anaerolineales bacterium]|jgi:uncharacterized protein (TIGR02118 family)
MHKLVILIETPDDPLAFEGDWPKFLRLAEKMPGLIKETSSHVEDVLYGNYPISFIHELLFADAQATYQAMASPQGREAGKQLQDMTNGRIVLFTADHREDDLAHINQFRKQEEDERPEANPG